MPRTCKHRSLQYSELVRPGCRISNLGNIAAAKPAVFIYLCLLLGGASAKSNIPSWHPRRAQRDSQIEVQQGVQDTTNNLDLVVNPSVGTDDGIPHHNTCKNCTDCIVTGDDKEPPPVYDINKLTPYCPQCKGCSHKFYAIEGKATFLGTEYKWEAGSSSAHILRAKGVSGTDNSSDPDSFVKFFCVPSTSKHGSKHCDLAQQERKVDSVLTVQRVLDECGLDKIATRAFKMHARAVMPHQPKNPATPEIPGGGRVDQPGIFTTAAPGISISNLAFTNAKNVDLLRRVNSEDVLQAALFDYLLCCMDRHAQNIFISEEGRITLIDNDLLLGGNQKGRTLNGECPTPGSLFLPGNLESFRVSDSPTKLWHLDYRCHTKDQTADIPLPPKLKQCLTFMKDSEPTEIMKKFGVKMPQIAENLKNRSRWLLELGFAEALKQVATPEKKKFEGFLAGDNVPKNKEKFKHWHANLWRPTMPPRCLDSGSEKTGNDVQKILDDIFANGV